MRLRVMSLLVASCTFAAIPTVPVSSAAMNSQKPTAQRTKAYGIDDWSAVMEGAVNPHGLETIWYFQLGTTKAYGLHFAKVSLEEPIGGAGSSQVEEAVDCLAPSTTYHFRLVAKNSAGKTYGPDQSFTTTRPLGSSGSVYARCPGHGPIN